jgi:hypothetical protein
MREAHLLRLQRAYGNTAVGWHLQRVRATAADPDPNPAARIPAAGAAPAPRVARSEPAPRSGATRVQRWKDEGHMQTAREAANAVFPDVAPFFLKIGMKRDEFIKQVEAASVNMDKFFPHLVDRFNPLEKETPFFKFVGTLAASEMEGDVTGQTRRGIKGEGPNHGEAGYYDVPRASGVAGNVAREDEFIGKALTAFKAGLYPAMIDRLGDAVHVSADRGSHDEGGQGEGHDTRKPDKSKGESGDNLTLGPGKNFMADWAANDYVGKNPDGYVWGLKCTMLVLSRFFDQVRPLAMDTSRLRPAPKNFENL